VQSGDVAESKVQTDLIEQGVHVALPLQSLSYDLVAEVDGEFYRVQVKRAPLKEDGVSKAQIKRSGRDYDNDGDQRKYGLDSFDVLAVWCVEWDEVAYTSWDDPTWSYTVRRSDEEVAPQVKHTVNVLGEQTFDKAIESFK